MAKTGKITNIDILRGLKNDKMMSSIKGDYKSFRSISKQLASLAVSDFDTFKSAQAMQVRGIPLFSKTGFKILKVIILNHFTPKTKAEKLLKKLLREEKAKNKALEIMKRYSRK
ncbi:MAG: hypothetical protein PHV68_10385 [Candidatus Gastranaerophilales bacterium]|nr:hypothetical protein [Candidatus Gastranaerophilales bacterium]